MMYIALASGLTLAVWTTLTLIYAAWLHKTETPEYKIVRDYMRAIRENEQ